MSEANLESDQTQMIDEKKESNFRVLFRSFKKNKLALISLIFVCLLFLVVIFGPWLTPYDPQEADYENLLSGPSLEHLAGTDEFGKDVLSRLIVGARAGTILGLISVFFGKLVDRIIMRGCDILFAFPDLVLAIGMVAILGPGLKNVIIAIAFFSTPSFARIVRGETLEIKEQLYV